jgi:serine/threonine protein kinase
MLPGQGGAQQGGVMGGQLSIDWDRVLTSCYDQVPTSLGGNGIAAAAQQPPYYALKVALPWEWEGEKGSPGWMVARHNHLKRCGSALLDEYHLLNKASGCDGIVRCHAMGFVKVDAFDVPLPALLLEYCAGGSLASRLWPAPPPPVEGAGQQQQGSCKRPGQPMTEEEARRYIIAVCNTVCYLHSMRIAHLDLKASNVLMSVDPDGTEHIKLADLGLAWDFSSSTAMSKHVYTPSHMAPELAEAGSWMRVEVDVWCVGLLILETRFAAEPFGYLFDREGLTAEERQRRRCPAELDNLDSDYYGRLGPLEKAVVRDCLRPLNTRPPLRELVKAHREYFGLSDDGP